MFRNKSWAAILLAAAGTAGMAGEPAWRAGVAAAIITPTQPLHLAGYAARTRPFARVEADLYAKALALQDQDGHRAVMITTDLIGLPASIAEPVSQRIAAKTGLGRAEILLSAAHTHSGPALTLSRSPSAVVSAADIEKTGAYVRQLEDRLVDIAVQAFERLGPAELSWGTGIAHFGMNRREFTPGGVILGVNPKGLVDRSVPILRVKDDQGRLRAVVFGYACHNTTLTQTNYQLCGDYAGFAQAYVQREHPTAQAMFMIGCGGDANPYPRGTVELAREHGATLGREVCRVLEGPSRPLRGPLRCVLDHATLPLQRPSADELRTAAASGPGSQRGSAREMLEALNRGERLRTDYRCPVSVWQFGTNLTLVALSGEVVVDYVPLIERAIGPLNLWVAAYCHDVFGYLPSARVLREGGYECRGLYTTQGWFAPEAEAALVEKVKELARRAGRADGSK